MPRCYFLNAHTALGGFSNPLSATRNPARAQRGEVISAILITRDLDLGHGPADPRLVREHVNISPFPHLIRNPCYRRMSE